MKVKLEQPITKQCGKFRLTYLLHASNDTVPISVWRVGGMRSAVCRVVIGLITCEYLAPGQSQ